MTPPPPPLPPAPAPDPPDPTTVAVVIRMPAALRDEVKAAAEADERNMAQAIRYALRQYVTSVTGRREAGPRP